MLDCCRVMLSCVLFVVACCLISLCVVDVGCVGSHVYVMCVCVFNLVVDGCVCCGSFVWLLCVDLIVECCWSGLMFVFLCVCVLCLCVVEFS